MPAASTTCVLRPYVADRDARAASDRRQVFRESGCFAVGGFPWCTGRAKLASARTPLPRHRHDPLCNCSFALHLVPPVRPVFHLDPPNPLPGGVPAVDALRDDFLKLSLTDGREQSFAILERFRGLPVDAVQVEVSSRARRSEYGARVRSAPLTLRRSRHRPELTTEGKRSLGRPSSPRGLRESRRTNGPRLHAIRRGLGSGLVVWLGRKVPRSGGSFGFTPQLGRFPGRLVATEESPWARFAPSV